MDKKQIAAVAQMDRINVAQAFQSLATQPGGQVALGYLRAVICMASESPMCVGDAHLTYYKAGRQDVWREIQLLLDYEAVPGKKPEVRRK